MNSSEAVDFGSWMAESFKVAPRGFTAIVVLLSFADGHLRPVAASIAVVTDPSLTFDAFAAHFDGQGLTWDGAAFFMHRDVATGGPVKPEVARGLRTTTEAAVIANPLTVNDGFFVDRTGRRVVADVEG